MVVFISVWRVTVRGVIVGRYGVCNEQYGNGSSVADGATRVGCAHWMIGNQRQKQGGTRSGGGEQGYMGDKRKAWGGYSTKWSIWPNIGKVEGEITRRSQLPYQMMGKRPMGGS